VVEVGDDEFEIASRLQALITAAESATSREALKDLCDRILKLLAEYDGIRWLQFNTGWASSEGVTRSGPTWRPTADVRRSPFPPTGPPQAHPLLAAASEVIVGAPFDLQVGISPFEVAGVAGERLWLAASDAIIGVQVIADGFRLAKGDSWRRDLHVTPEQPYRRTVFQLVADDPGGAVAARQIRVSYTVGGDVVGFGARSIAVLRSAALLGTQPPSRQESPAHMPIAPGGESPADLTVLITYANDVGRYCWSYESPHVAPPADTYRLGVDAQRFARHLIEQVQRKDGDPDLLPVSAGKGSRHPGQRAGRFFAALRQVAEIVGPRRPTVLIQSVEPYVPWELAELPIPVGPLPTPVSWLSGHGRSVGFGGQRPPGPASARAVACRHHVGRFRRVRRRRPALAAAAMRQGGSARAGHGPRRGVGGCRARRDHGLVGKRDDPGHPPLRRARKRGSGRHRRRAPPDRAQDPQFSTIKGSDLPTGPFVFLNACQVGTGDTVLGDYGGIAAAFLYAGSGAVVAPLWSVKDCVAKISYWTSTAGFGGERPADAIRELRCRVGGPQSTVASALAYQFFGHPTMTIGARRAPDT